MQLFTISLVKLLGQPKTEDKTHILEMLISDILNIEDLDSDDDLSVNSFLKSRRSYEKNIFKIKKPPAIKSEAFVVTIYYTASIISLT